MVSLRIRAAAGLLLVVHQCAFGGQAAVFWASDPVRPGEAAVIVGEGFGGEPAAEVAQAAGRGAVAVRWAGGGR